MKTKRSSRPFRGAKPLAISAVGLGVLFALTPTLAAEADAQARGHVLRHASAKHGIPIEELKVLNAAEVDYPSAGVKVMKAKVQTPQGDVVGVHVDESGAEVSEERLAQLEASAQADRKVHPELARRLSGAGPQDKLRVILWLKEPDQAAAGRPDAEEEATLPADRRADIVFSRADTQRAAMVQQLAGPFLRSLRALDPDAQGDRHSPAVYATLPAAAVARVARWTEVAAVYEDAVNEPDLDIARQAILANAVNNLGITGSGVHVAQIEVGGRVATANPYLSGVVQDFTSVCASASSHSTGVAGIIRSRHATVRGVAPNVTLRAGGSCGGSSSELQSRSTAAADWGARVLNLSWGSNTNLVPGANDRFYDDMVINRFRTIVKSAGNEGGPCGSGTGNVTSPGLAYNVITVGNFDDRNTSSWSGDVMSSCSSWKDPTSAHGDREKPEIAAPGTNFTSTSTASPWIGGIGSGTSYAAPMVTGTAALMMQRNTSLQLWPEAVKAILMVSAVHNIEGSTRLSEFDGAGGIVANRADIVASARRTTGSYGWDAGSYDCLAPVNKNLAVMSLTAGVRTRVAIVWDQNPGYGSYATQPSADLDLQVLNPSGASVSVSSSWDNTYEIVDFTPSVSGSHTLRVNKYRCDLTPRWLGFAWRVGS
jgi:hypothetical protein